VLVVEPEVRIRAAVARYLRECGYKVLEASGADEALTLLRAGIPIHVLFSEVQLPGDVDGFVLGRMAREIVPAVKMVLTSGSNRTARQAADLCDEKDVMSKPYSHEELARRIRMLLAE
jgi:DNA-binding response OmpR family regulator